LINASPLYIGNDRLKSRKVSVYVRDDGKAHDSVVRRLTFEMSRDQRHCARPERRMICRGRRSKRAQVYLNRMCGLVFAALAVRLLTSVR
jgi:hypothetical protein